MEREPRGGSLFGEEWLRRRRDQAFCRKKHKKKRYKIHEAKSIAVQIPWPHV